MSDCRQDVRGLGDAAAALGQSGMKPQTTPIRSDAYGRVLVKQVAYLALHRALGGSLPEIARSTSRRSPWAEEGRGVADITAATTRGDGVPAVHVRHEVAAADDNGFA